ncbi:MAG: hypothetical protein WAK91_00050 [Candidatus Acidiferrales bacterium]|jgi:hypothetical protein
MILATLALLFQAPAVPVRTDVAAQNAPNAVYYAANFTDERTSVVAFQPKAPNTTATAPTTSRFDQDGIRLLNLSDDGSKAKPTSAEPVFPDMTSKILASVHIPPQLEKLPPLPERRTSVLRPGHSWLALALMQSSAATFDAWTTNRAVAQGHSELNPMLRPVAGSPAMYAAIQVTPILFDFIGRKMQHSENGMVRRMWWVPQVIGTATSFGAGIRNLAVSH